MTFWLVILFTMLAIVSPVLWLRPSRHDQRLGRLRQQAGQAGIEVKFAKPPLHSQPGGMISYRWAYARDRSGPVFLLVRDAYASEVLKPFMAGWRWRIEPLRPLASDTQRLLQQALAQLPEDALVVESDRRYLTLWWSESLDETRFVPCQEALTAVHGALVADSGRRTGHSPGMPP